MNLETDPQPTGLLTSTERDQLVDEATATERRNEILAQVRQRLAATLEDMCYLYPTLRASDIDAVFDSEDEQAHAETRLAIQDTLALLVLGMLHSDDHIELRIADAIRAATLSYGKDVTVDLDLRRGPFLPFERCLARFKAEGATPDNLDLFETLVYRSDVEFDQLRRAATTLGIGQSAETETLVAEHDALCFERPPQAVVTGIDVTTAPSDPEGAE